MDPMDPNSDELPSELIPPAIVDHTNHNPIDNLLSHIPIHSPTNSRQPLFIRTVSGLPLCSVCHHPAGQCSHSDSSDSQLSSSQPSHSHSSSVTYLVPRPIDRLLVSASKLSDLDARNLEFDAAGDLVESRESEIARSPLKRAGPTAAETENSKRRKLPAENKSAAVEEEEENEETEEERQKTEINNSESENAIPIAIASPTLGKRSAPPADAEADSDSDSVNASASTSSLRKRPRVSASPSFSVESGSDSDDSPIQNSTAPELFFTAQTHAPVPPAPLLLSQRARMPSISRFPSLRLPSTTLSHNPAPLQNITASPTRPAGISLLRQASQTLSRVLSFNSNRTILNRIADDANFLPIRTRFPNPDLFVYCDSCCDSKPIQFSCHCKTCKSQVNPANPPVDYSSLSASNSVGFCIQCNSQTDSFILPRCSECDSVAAPLTQLFNNKESKLSCCCCFSAEDRMILFPCDPNSHNSPADNEFPPPHLQCFDCFLSYAGVSISERRLVFDKDRRSYTIACPIGCANSSLDPPMLRLLGAEYFAKFKRFAAINFAESHSLVWCPFKDCLQGFEPPNDCDLRILQCAACKRNFCRICHKSPESHNSNNSACGFTDLSEADRLSMLHILELTKPCPNCNVRIVKTEGCNHFKCSRCAFEFCWVDLKKWGPECERGHIYESAVKSRIYSTLWGRESACKKIFNGINNAMSYCSIM